MSLSVGSSNNNPFALWQSLLQPNSTGSSAQSDPLASLLATLGQSGAAAISTAGTSSSSATTAGASGNSSPQFGPQTLQTLFDLQANGSNSQSLLAQLGGDGSTTAAPSDSSSSSGNSSAQSGGTNVANNNLLERLIQMQAQLVASTTTQSIATV
jgi:hypothetical protein